MARLIQLSGRSQSCWTRSHDSYGLPSPFRRPAGTNDAFLEGTIDDRDLDVLDGYRVGVDSQYARSFARRRTEAARELGKVVGCEKPQQRFLPLPAVDQVIPVGNNVSKRTTLVTERNAAIHASRGLSFKLVLRKFFVDFLPVVDPFLNRPAFKTNSRKFKKTCRVTHVVPSRT